MRMKALIALAVAVLVTVPSMPHASASKRQDITAALFEAINNGRVDAGLSRVKEWDVITTEARKHSVRQAEAGQISHKGFAARARRIQNAGSGVNGVCENVAFVSGVRDVETIVRTFYRGWDQSPPHHACLFDEDFHTTWAGVGVARSGSAWYATYIGAQDASPAQP
jgi:uncharacterized protein YkwD